MLPTFNNTPTNSDGLETLMHPGEIEIMRLFWTRGPMRIRDIHQAVRQYRPIAYTTISTRCYRLLDQGLLARPTNGNFGDPLVAKMSEHELVAQRLAKVLDALSYTYPSALTHYVTVRQVGV